MEAAFYTLIKQSGPDGALLICIAYLYYKVKYLERKAIKMSDTLQSKEICEISHENLMTDLGEIKQTLKEINHRFERSDDKLDKIRDKLINPK